MPGIMTFRGRFGFLSNMREAPVVLDGVTYPSVEHAYQAAKTADPAERVYFTKCTASEAKKRGYKVTKRPDFDDNKLSIMLGLVRQKFQHPELKELLLATGDTELIEGNTWHDTYWGKCTCAEHKGEGGNRLGLILMKVRNELKGAGVMKKVAIIGSRDLTAEDFDLIVRLGFWLVVNGRMVVTGGAYGADHAAMLGASLGAQAKGIALDQVLTVFKPWHDYNLSITPKDAKVIVGGWDAEDQRLAHLHPKFDALGQGAQKMMLRNAQIVRLSDTVVARPRVENFTIVGGTAHGVNCAKDLKRALVLLSDPKQRQIVVNQVA